MLLPDIDGGGRAWMKASLETPGPTAKAPEDAE